MSNLFINSYPQVKGRECYPTAGERLSSVGVQGVTGDKLLAESGDASNGWLWSGCSTKARKRRELEPAKRLIGRLKQGNVPIRPRSMRIRGIHSIRGTRRTVPIKSRKMDTRNGVTHQWLSQRWEQAARPYALVGGMPQEANAQGNTWDRLTWGRHTRGHGCSKSLGLRRALMDAGYPSVLKTGHKSNPDCACAKLRG